MGVYKKQKAELGRDKDINGIRLIDDYIKVYSNN